MAVYQRQKIWGDETLYPADLNNEFDAVKEAVNNIDAAQLNTGCVTEQALDANAVTHDKLADEAVTESKLADHSISRKKIQDDEIYAGKVERVAETITDLANNATAEVTHGFTDENGNKRNPFMIVAYVIGSDTFGNGQRVKYIDAGVKIGWDGDKIYIKNSTGSTQDIYVVAW